MTYNTGKFEAATAGAKTGLFMETVVFSEISDLVLTGTNVDAEYGISFNGCETPFRIYTKGMIQNGDNISEVDDNVYSWKRII